MSETPTTFPAALVMLAMDPRDPELIQAVTDVADRLGIQRVVAAHVYKRDPFPDFLPESLRGSTVPTGEDPEALEAALDQIKAALPSRDVVGVHAVGDPAEELARIIQQEDIDLLIIGRNPAAGDGPGWGPSGLKLLRTAGVSALVFPLGGSHETRSVVCGLDFSHTSTAALQVAASVADELDVICQYSDSAIGLTTHSHDEFRAELTKNATAHFDDHVRPHLPASTRVELRIVEGDRPSQVLIDAAGQRMLVVGSRGLSQFAARFLGSTAERVAGYAHGPVLIVRKKGESLGLLEGLVHR